MERLTLWGSGFIVGCGFASLIVTLIWKRIADRRIKDYNNEVHRYYEMKNKLESEIGELTTKMREYETVKELKGLA